MGADPLFADKVLDWKDCPQHPVDGQPFKWEDPTLFKPRWVGGDCFFLELPWIDQEGYDIGIPRDAALMDGDARLIVCEKTPKCVAVNLSGWMKHSLVIDAVSKPVKTKRLYLKVPINATSDELAHIKE